jgi:hypothetical protein
MDSGVFGRSWSHSFESRVIWRRAATMLVGGYSADGSRRYYYEDAENTGDVPSDSENASVPAIGTGGAAILSGNSFNVIPDFTAELRTPDGRRLVYKRQAGGSFKGPVEDTSVFSLIGSSVNP